MPISQSKLQNRGGKVGTIVAMAAIPPDQENSFILCDGRGLNTYVYRRLHATINNTYGGTAYVANVTDQPGVITIFNIPDLRGKVLKGAVNMSSNANIAQYTGSNTMSMDAYALQTTDVPSHQHGIDGGTNYAFTINEAAIASQGNAVTSYRISRGGDFRPNENSANSIPNTTGGHSHTDASTLQPSLVLNYYIQVF